MIVHCKKIALFGFLFVVLANSLFAQQDSSQAYADKIMAAKIPVLIDFWAPWCAPCRMLLPTLTQLEKEHAEKILLVRINIDIHQKIASYFGISKIPAVYVILDSTIVETIEGYRPKQDYVDAINKALAISKKNSALNATPPKNVTKETKSP